MGSHTNQAGTIYSLAPRADNPALPYESRYERFECRGPEGQNWAVEFVRAGTLTAGDCPELYFFRANGEEVVVGISGAALEAFQKPRRLTREEKVDVAGLHLHKQIARGLPLDSRNLAICLDDLATLANELRLEIARRA